MDISTPAISCTPSADGAIRFARLMARVITNREEQELRYYEMHVVEAVISNFEKHGVRYRHDSRQRYSVFIAR